MKKGFKEVYTHNRRRVNSTKRLVYVDLRQFRKKYYVVITSIELQYDLVGGPPLCAMFEPFPLLITMSISNTNAND